MLLQIVLCENNLYSQGIMDETLTHELVHSYDHCRAHVDWKDLKHLACSEIRAASLSGECFFWKENFARLKFGWKKHHQVHTNSRTSDKGHSSTKTVEDTFLGPSLQLEDSIVDNWPHASYPYTACHTPRQ